MTTVSAQTEYVIEPAVVRSVAARAARSTPGVARLEPGVWDLAKSWSRSTWQKVRGVDSAPADGVHAQVTDGAAAIQLSIATTGREPAFAVAQAVQRSISGAVSAQTGLKVTEVRVSIIDVEPA
ncbi:Asp23/Gls24 family envelope stress response protein [Pseudonocardiaceae bacterium YIM PH 21723]|nr:Asp23/Gls24 family envelope stress response protein [Pseudonocardiaceae bacterium YIM PH 21723]